MKTEGLLQLFNTCSLAVLQKDFLKRSLRNEMICPQVPKQLRNRQKSMKSDKMTIKRLAGVRYAPGFTLYLEPTFSRVPFHYSRVVNRANAVLTWLLTALTKCLLWVNSWAILAKLAIRHIFIDKVGNSLHRHNKMLSYFVLRLAPVRLHNAYRCIFSISAFVESWGINSSPYSIIGLTCE